MPRCRPHPWDPAVLIAAVLLGVTLAGGDARGGAVFDRVRAAQQVRCGVLAQGGVNVAGPDGAGVWRGFFPDFCRVVAAAATGRAGNVTFVEYAGKGRFETVRSGDVDVIMGISPADLVRAAREQVTFPAIYFHDDIAIAAHPDFAGRSLADLQSMPATVCGLTNTYSLQRLQLLAAASHPGLAILQVDTHDGYLTAFATRRCALVAQNRLILAVQAAHNDLGDAILLPPALGRAPMSPIVRADDPAWAALVRWAIYATIEAEVLGVSQANLAERRAQDSRPDVRLLLGLAPGAGAALGIADDWAARIVAQVGNYGDIFERNLGRGSDLKLERGPNRPWTEGGLLYAPPFD